jgi:hypothetical protein
MSYNGSGTFLINTAGQPVVSGTVISSTAFNSLTADLATGLSTAITKDGQTTVTANIPMSTYKFTGLGVGSAATDSANLSQVQSTVTKLLNSVSGADTITATASPTLAAYATGQMFYFVAAGDNTTSVTLNIDSLGAKAVTRDGSVALAAADIKSGEVVVVVYDGTRFQVVSQLNSAGDARFANVSIASSLYVGGVSTFVGNAGFSANVSIASALSVGGVAAITGATTIGGNLTLSGGTANGVVYLDGSKVATSGSAVTYNGTTFALGAAWTSNPFGQTAAPGYFQYSASNQTLRIAGDAQSNFQAFRFSNDGGAPAMTLGKARGTYASPSAVQTGDNLGDLQFRGYGGTNSRTLANVLSFVETYTSDSNISSYLEFRTSSSGSASATEKMRLDSSGNLGIGTSSPTSGFRLDLQAAASRLRIESTTGTSTAETRTINTGGTLYAGVDSSGGSLTGAAYAAYYFYSGNYPLIFGTNNAERARITSGGYFKASNNGTYLSSTADYHELTASGAAGDYIVNITTPTSTAANCYGARVFYNGAAPNGTGNAFLQCQDNAATRAQIRSNGGLANYQSNNVDLSDIRTKKDIAPAASMWGKIGALEIVTYKYNDQTHDDVNVGVIAQQVESVEPVWVDADGFGETPEDGTPLKTVYTKDITFAAIKALQEAMSRIEQLEAKVAALENK